jgi:hypothetical protein
MERPDWPYAEPREPDRVPGDRGEQNPFGGGSPEGGRLPNLPGGRLPASPDPPDGP